MPPRLPDFTSLGQTPAPQAPLSIARVETQPLEFNVRQGVGEAAIRGGREIASAGFEMQQHIDTLNAEDRYNNVIQGANELKVSPQNGFENVKGSAAMDQKFYKNYMDRFGNLASAQEATLSNDNQKALFRRRAAVAASQYQGALFTHMSQQTSAFADNTEKTSVQVEINNASNAKTDADFDTSMTRIRGVLDARGARLNEPPAETELNKQKAISTAWTDRIKVLATSDPLAAQAMYNANSAQIGFGEKVVLEHQLKQLVTPIQAKNLAMSVIAGANVDDIVQAVTVGGDNALNNVIAQRERVDEGLPRTKVDSKANLAQWVADAEDAAQRVKPNDPVFRDAVVSQLKGYVNTLVSAQDGVSRAAHGLLMNAAIGPDGKNKPLKLDDLLTTPELRAAWAVTSPGSQRGFYAMFEHNAKTPKSSDPRTMEEIFRRVNLPADDPNKIRSPGQLMPFFMRGLNNHTDYDWFEKRIDERETPEGQKMADTRKRFFDAIRPQFDKTTMFNFDAKGKEDFYKFQQYGTELERQSKGQQGKDPYDLYNPNSPEYLGKKVQSFQRTLDEQIRGMAERLRQPTAKAPAAPELQRREGETIDDWIARTRR